MKLTEKGCHVMEKESFENDEVASILNREFIPIKIDREERPDIDRIYLNFVQATSGSGGWPLNVFVTPTLEPLFGGTYWPGPQSHTRQRPLEEQVNFLDILNKLAKVWKEQEGRCRQDSKVILEQLKSFAAEGTLNSKSKLGEGETTLDLDLLDEACRHLASTFDTTFSGFGDSQKFPTPARLIFLLRLRNFPQPVIDIVGQQECDSAQFMALRTLRAIDRGGIHDHVGHGFARYSVTRDWGLPHFEKMLYDNAQLLHTYLDAFFGLEGPDAELLGVVYDLAKYLTQTRVAAPNGGFFSSEDADSYYRKGDDEKREGAYYVWTRRELDTILGKSSGEIIAEFFGVLSDGNVEKEHDVHDEFINQNVLKILKTPAALAQQFGVSEKDIVSIVKDSKAKLREHREAERVPPDLDDKIVCAWNGIAIGALARTGATLSSVDPAFSMSCSEAAIKAAEFIKKEMYNEQSKTLKRVWREGPGDTEGFTDDYAFLISGLIDLYESTFDDMWLKWADELQGTQIRLFHDNEAGGFFATAENSEHVILRLKDGMDNAEPSANGVSATNLFRLSTLLEDEEYEKIARGTLAAFEAEIMQYPWLFGSFMPSIVAAECGVKGVIRVGAVTVGEESGAATSTKKGIVQGTMTPGGHLTESGEARRDFPFLSNTPGNTQHQNSISPSTEKFEPSTSGTVDSFNPALSQSQVEGARQSRGKTTSNNVPLPRMRARGAIETRFYIDRSHGLWLKSRNKLVGELKAVEGEDRVMVCEGRRCREVEVDGEGERFADW